MLKNLKLHDRFELLRRDTLKNIAIIFLTIHDIANYTIEYIKIKDYDEDSTCPFKSCSESEMVQVRYE
jgi:hypothetical protein